MKRKLTSLALMALLIAGSISQAACGNTTTLDRVGRAAVNIAQAVVDEVAALKASGLTGPKLDRIEKSAVAFKTSADVLKDYLDGLKDVSDKDAAAITQQIAKAVNIANALLMNPDVLGLGEGSKLVQVLRYSGVALNQLSLSLAVFFPPPAAGQVGVSSVGGKTVAKAKIKVELSEPPPAVKAILAK